MVFGQMNEPPGARLRVALSGVTARRILPRQRGPGRPPVRRQHLPVRPGRPGGVALRAACRARSATSRPWPPRWRRCRSGSRRPRRARSRPCRPYVPADDITDPAPATTFSHLDATIVPDRHFIELQAPGPPRPLKLTSRLLEPKVVGDEHYKVARDCSASSSATRTCRTSSRSWAWRSSPTRTSASSPAPGASRGCCVPAVLRRRAVHRHEGQVRPPQGDGPGVQGDSRWHDNLPEQAFYMVGGIDEAVEKAKKMAGG